MKAIIALEPRKLIRAIAFVDTISPIHPQVALSGLWTVLGLMLQDTKTLMYQFSHRRA